MAFLRKTKKLPGWMALELRPEGLGAVHVVRPQNGKPSVESALFFPAEGLAQGELLARASRDAELSGYHCTTLLASGEYQLLSVEAPNVQPDELKAAIRWRLKDMIDFHIDDATFDVLDVPVDRNAGARHHNMYAIAARNQLIRERQTLFIENKVPLSVIDIPEMAQRNLAALVEPEGRGVAFLSFDTGGGLLTITYNGELYLTRRIEVPLSLLQDGSEEQRRGHYDRVTLELQRSLDHFERQYHFITVARLVLSPLGEAGAGLRDYLAGNLYVAVEMMALEDVLDLSKTPELRQPAAQRRFLMALGAALRHEEKAL